MNARWASQFPEINYYCCDLRCKTTPTLVELFNPRQSYCPHYCQNFSLKLYLKNCMVLYVYLRVRILPKVVVGIDHSWNMHLISDPNLWLTLSIPYFRLEQKMIPHFTYPKIKWKFVSQFRPLKSVHPP